MLAWAATYILCHCQVVLPLLFANDLCLILLSMQGLQKHMDTLQAFGSD